MEEHGGSSGGGSDHIRLGFWSWVEMTERVGT